jgi:hypothetical protein
MIKSVVTAGILVALVGIAFTISASPNSCILPRGPMPRTFPSSCVNNDSLGITISSIGVALSLAGILSVSLLSGVVDAFQSFIRIAKSPDSAGSHSCSEQLKH